MSSNKGKTKTAFTAKPEQKQSYTDTLLLVFFGIFIVFMTTSKLSNEDDFFWHFATGKYIIENGRIPGEDVFSYTTPGDEWIPFEWGWDVISYLIFVHTGYTGLSIFNTLIFLVIFYLYFSLMRKFNISYTIIFLFFILMTFVIFERFVPRPQVVSYLFYVVLISIIANYKYFRKNSQYKSIFLIPFIFLAWANIHMGVLVGAVIFVIFVLSEFIIYLNPKRISTSGIASSLRSSQISNTTGEIKSLNKPMLIRITLIFLASILMLLINPHGLETYKYVFSHLQMSKMTAVNEWISPFDRKYSGQIYTITYYIYLAVSVSVLYYSFKKKDLFSFIIYIVFAVNSFRALRFVTDFLLITLLYTAAAVSFIIYETNNKKFIEFINYRPLMKLALIVILTLLCTGIINNSLYEKYLGYPRYFGTGLDSSFFPVKMFDFMKENKITEIGEKPFNTYECGGYFLWNFPGQTNFIDSRAVNDRVLNEFDVIYSMKPGFEKKIQNYNIDYAIFSERDLTAAPQYMKQFAIFYFASRKDEWKLIYWDDHSLLFVRNLPKFERLISDYEYKFVTPYDIMFQKPLIEKAMEENYEEVVKEKNKKTAEEPNGIYINYFLKSYGNRLKK